jgi:MFS family permease
MSYRQNIPRVYAFSALTAFQLWMPVWVVFMQERGLTLGQIGLLDAIAWLLIAAAEVPTGVVADTWGRKTSLIIGALFHGIGVLGLLTEVLSPVFLVCYFMWGLSMTFWSGANDALVYDSLRAEGLEETFVRVDARWALVTQASGMLAGLAGALVAAVDLRLAFVITGVSCLAAAGVGLTFREPPRFSDSGSRPGYRENLTRGLRIAVVRPRVRYLVLLGAIVLLFPMMLSISMFQPYAREVGIPVWALGLLFLGMRGASMTGSLLAPIAVVRVRREWLLVAGPLLVAGLLALLGLLASRPAVLLLGAIMVVTYTVRPLLSAMLNDSIPSEQRATIISLQSLVFTLVIAGVQPALYAIGGRTSMALAVGLAGVLMASLSVPVLVLLFRAPADRDVPTAQLAVAND